MNILLVGFGHIGQAFMKLVEKYGCRHKITICDPLYNHIEVIAYIREHHAEIDLVINLTGQSTKRFLDLILEHQLMYVDRGIEKEHAEISSYDYYKPFHNLKSNSKILLGFGMNPGIVEHIYFKNRPDKRHIAAVFETDTASKDHAIFNTWLCESCYLQASVNNKAISTAQNPYIAFDSPPVHFTVENKQYFPDNKLDETEVEALKIQKDVAGTRKAGILMYDYSDHLVYYYNALSHADVFAECKTNATCWQTACGVYLGMEMMEVVEKGTVATVSDLSVKWPDEIDSVLEKLNFVVSTSERYVDKEEFVPFITNLRDQSGRNKLPAQRKLPLCDEQEYIFAVNEAIPSIPLKVSYTIEFAQEFSLQELFFAIERCIQNADIFGARIVVEDGRPYMEFMPYHKKEIPVFDFATSAEYQTFRRKAMATQINTRDKLYSIFIYSIAGSCYHICLCFNHLVCDAISGLLLGEKIQKVLVDRDAEVTWHPYSAFLDKINRYNQSEKYLQDKEFWENRFYEISQCEYFLPDVIDTKESAAKNLLFQTSCAFKVALLEYCSEHNISPHMVIVAVLARAFSHKTGRKRFYVEMPIGNRSGMHEKNSLGTYEIAPPVIFDFINTNTFADLFESVKKQSRDYYKHKNFDWNRKIFSESNEKKYGRYIPQFCFSYFCENKKPPVQLATYHYIHSETDYLPMTVLVSDFLDWQTITFEYKFWASCFSEPEILEIHNAVETGLTELFCSTQVLCLL